MTIKKEKDYIYAYEKANIPTELKAKFTAKAKKLGVYKSDVIRKAIHAFVHDKNNWNLFSLLTYNAIQTSVFKQRKR